MAMMLDIEDTYQRPYRLRMAQPGAKTLEVTFPYEVVEREARRNGLSIDEFVKQFQVVAHFNGIDGVVYTFQRIDNPQNKD
jgi:hypothetical protein